MLNTLLLFVAAMLWHEIAHMYVALRYDVMLGVVLFSGPGWRRIMSGPGVAIERDALTPTQRRAVSFAPLAHLPVAAVGYGVYQYTGNGIGMFIAVLFGVAAGMALFSDVPQELGLIEIASDEMDIYWLVDHREVSK